MFVILNGVYLHKKYLLRVFRRCHKMRVMTVLMPFTKKVYMTIVNILFDANTTESIFVFMKQANESFRE